MSDNIKIKITIDGNSKDVVVAKNEVNKLKDAIKGTQSNVNLLNGSFKALLGIGASLYALKSTFDAISTSIINENRQMQNLTNQMSSLIFATTSNISASGKLLNVREKQNLANIQATKTIKELVAINKQTPHNLQETISIYNTLSTGFKKAGASMQDMIKITQKLSIAANAGGVNFNSLLAGVDALASGSVVAGSDLGRFLDSIGLSNEKIKSSSNVVKLFLDELGRFEAIDSFDTRLSNLQNSFSNLTRELGKPLFDIFNDFILKLNTLLSGIDINSFKNNLYESFDIVTKLAGAFLALKTAVFAYNAVITTATALMPLFTSATNFSIAATAGLSASLRVLNTAFATLLPIATIYLLYESIDVIKALNGEVDKIGSNFNVVQKFIFEFADAFSTQLQLAYVGLLQFINDIKIKALEAKKFFIEINNEYNPFGKNINTSYIVKQIKTIQDETINFEKLKKGYNEASIQRYLKLYHVQKEINKDEQDSLKNLFDTTQINNEILKTLNPQAYKIQEINAKWEALKNTIEDNKDSIKDYALLLENIEKANEAEINSLNTQKPPNITAIKDYASEALDILKQHYTTIKNYEELNYINITEFSKKVLANTKLTQEQKASIISSYNDEILTQDKQRLSQQENEYISFYTKIGDKAKAWSLKEKHLREQLAKFITKDNKKAVENYIKQEKDAFLKVQTTAKDAFSEIKNEWDNITSSMSQSFEDNFFSFLTGKTKSLKDMFKSLGKDLLSNITNPIARTLSKSLGGAVSGALGFKNDAIASTMKDAGLSLVKGQWINAKSQEEASIIVSSSGEIIKGASELSKGTTDALSTAVSAYSAISTGYKMLTEGISNTVFNGFNNAGNALFDMGFTNAGTGVANFGAGFSSPFAGGYSGASLAGAYASSALMGAGIGYGIGSLGDMLFGADTYAGAVGAAGGAIGGIGAVAGLWGGPIGMLVGSVLGSIIGGIFGKWKTKDYGLELFSDIDIDFLSSDLANYIYKKKKAWFSSKKKTEYTSLHEDEIQAIRNIFNSYDYLLSELGATKQLIVQKGRYSNKDGVNGFQDEGIVKGIINAMSAITSKSKSWFGTKTTIINKEKLDRIYDLWKGYAKEIDKSVYDAMSEVLKQSINTKRKFNEFMLKDNSVSLHEFRANYMQKDYENIAKSLNVNFAKLTKENFLDKYNEAIKNSLDPATLNGWNALAQAFISASDASKQLTQAQKEYSLNAIAQTQNLYNSQIAYLSAVGKDTLPTAIQAQKATILGIAQTYDKREIKDWKQIENWVNSIKKLGDEGKLSEESNVNFVKEGYSNKEYQSKIKTEIIKLISLQEQQKKANLQANVANFTTANYVSAPTLMYEALDKLIAIINQGSNSLKSVFNTSKNVIDKLFSTNKDYVKNEYNKYLNLAKLYQKQLTTDFNDKVLSNFSNAVSNLSSYVDKYLDKDNYSTKFDYDYNEAMVANQFSEFKESASVYEKLSDIANELKKLRDEAKTQTSINEATASGTRELNSLLEAVANGKISLSVEVAN